MLPLSLVLLKAMYVTGASYTYQVVLDYKAIDGTDETILERETTFTVGKSAGQGLTEVSGKSRLLKVTMNGQVLSNGDVQEASEWTEKRAANGQVYENPFDKTFPVLLARQSRPLVVRFPGTKVENGQKWTFSVPEDPESGLSSAQWDWTLDGSDEKTASITIGFHERDVAPAISGEGTATFDLADGWLRRLDMTLGPTLVPGDEERVPVQLHVVWTRK